MINRVVLTLSIATVIGSLFIAPAVSASSASVTSLVTPVPATYDGGIPFSIEVNRNGSLSANGDIIVYTTPAADYAPDDTNKENDVFVYDSKTRKTELISRNPSGKPANGRSFSPTVTADGRYVAFASDAKDIVPGIDQNCAGFECDNIFLYDRSTKKLRQVNILADGTHIPSAHGFDMTKDPPVISRDGRYITFVTNKKVNENDINNWRDFVRYDLQTKSIELVSVDHTGKTSPESVSWRAGNMSRDGRFVIFESRMRFPGTAPYTLNIFVRDMKLGTTRLVSVAYSGQPANHDSYGVDISGDGRYVAFTSYATNLLENRLRHRGFEDADAFVRVHTGMTKLINKTADGRQSERGVDDVDINDDGRFISYSSGANDLSLPAPSQYQQRIYLYDRQHDITRRIDQASGDGIPSNNMSWRPAISDDGTTIAFCSRATNLTPDLAPPAPGQPYANVIKVHNPAVRNAYYDPIDFIHLLR